MDGRRTSPPFKGRIYAAFKGPSVAYARGFAALRGRLRNAKIPRPGDRGPPGLDLDIASIHGVIRGAKRCGERLPVNINGDLRPLYAPFLFYYT